MKFEHCVKVYDRHGEWIGMLEPQDEAGGKPIAWCFVAQDDTLSQEEVEAIAAKLRELNKEAHEVKGG